MREKPDLQESDIQECLFHQYGLRAAEIVFLPRGGDYDAAVYQVIGGEGAAYFLKLRRERGPGRFTDLPLRVADFLSGSGIREIIAPVRTIRGGLSTALGEYTAVVYPFVPGTNAFETPLTGQQWVAFGRALRKVHSARIPAELRSRLKRETYAPTARERVNAILDRAEKGVFHDPVADQYAGFLVEKAGEIRHIVQKAGELAAVVQAQQPRLVLCHSDLHAGNLLVDPAGDLYMVDWDDALLAAKERDLMFIGGGVGSAWFDPQEARLFYQGYGPAEINPAALAYYRLERIAQDIADWGERVLLSEEGGAERVRWLGGLRRWFQENDVVEMAYEAERGRQGDGASVDAGTR